MKGEAIVSLTRQRQRYYHSFASDVLEDSVIKTVTVDGKGTVEFDTTDDLKLSFETYEHSFNYVLKATVIEDLTGRNQSASKDITIHANRYKIEKQIDQYEFNAGLPVTFSVSIKHQDDSPILVNDETKFVMVGKITNRYSPENEKIEYSKFELNSNGTFQVNIPTSRQEVNFHLTMKYLGEETDLGYFWPQTISEPSELQIKVLTKR